MKINKLIKILSLETAMVLLFSMFLIACFDDDDIDKDCDKNKWPNALDYSPQPRLLLKNVKFISFGVPYDILQANDILFAGTVEKFHCDGTKGQRYEYYTSFDPRVLNETAITTGVFAGYPITFKFQHDKDYLKVIYTIDVRWEDSARAHCSAEQQVHHTDIIPDIEFLKEYFMIEVDINNPKQYWLFYDP
jgi:hypothetical protein